MTKQFLVYGWFNTADYDAGLPASVSTVVNAVDEERAEHAADMKFKRKGEKCAVVETEDPVSATMAIAR